MIRKKEGGPVEVLFLVYVHMEAAGQRFNDKKKLGKIKVINQIYFKMALLIELYVENMVLSNEEKGLRLNC